MPELKNFRTGLHVLLKNRRPGPGDALLLNSCAPTLNEHKQHDNKQRTGNNSNNRNAIHKASSFSIEILRLHSTTLSRTRAKLVTNTARTPASTGQQYWPSELMNAQGHLVPHAAVLLDPCAAALNQQSQHDDKQDAGYNSNNQNTIHLISSFLND